MKISNWTPKMRPLLGLFLAFCMLFSEVGCSASGAQVTAKSSEFPSPTASAAGNASSTPSSDPSPTSSTSPSPTPSANSTAIVSGELEVNFLDVGQGDSIFIELPNGQTMLIDAGNAVNGGDIVNYINHEGYDTIDYLVATHPHADHIGGMAEVIEDLDIESVYMPKVQNDTQTFENLLTAIQNKGLQINTAKSGVSILDTGNLDIEIVAPVNSSYDDLNNYSAVIKLTYGNNVFLFMGDAEALSEGEITANINADVLKVGHHGSTSSTSQTFLNAVSPKYAVISVGEDNSYGHPAQTTLDKLKAAGAIIYRTDKDGTVVFSSDGKSISVNKTAASSVTQATPTPTIAVTPAPTIAATPKPTVTEKPAVTDKQEVTVYITKTGSKYHRDGCRYLSKSKIAISLSDAKAQGYEPCSVCNPPT